MFSQLFDFQRKMIRLPQNNTVRIDTDWNFYHFFNDKIKLKKVKSHFALNSEIVTNDWAEYAKQIIWFGKRHSMTLFMNGKETPDYFEEEN